MISLSLSAVRIAPVDSDPSKARRRDGLVEVRQIAPCEAVNGEITSCSQTLRARSYQSTHASARAYDLYRRVI